MKRVISIDHGNRLIKGRTYAFPASFVEGGFLPSIGGDVLKYDGQVYALADLNLPVLNDKTEDERYFILTLFAVGKEIAAEMDTVRKLTPNEFIEIELLIGLPLQHYEIFRNKFVGYFINRARVIRFELNGKSYAIRFTAAYAYPQAFAAAITAHDKLKVSRIVNVVDIGGHTIDCLQLNNFTPNLALCTSLYGGVNRLFQSINEKSRGDGGSEISNIVIEEILRGSPDVSAGYSEKRVKIVTSTAAAQANMMLAEIAQKGFDLNEDITVFMGGGSILLKKYIEKAGKAKKPVFIEDIHANAKGYQIIHERHFAGAL